MVIQCDHVIEAREDIVVIMKKEKVCIACKQALCGTRTGWNLVPGEPACRLKSVRLLPSIVPRDYLIDDKGIQKVEKYHDLKQSKQLAFSQKFRYMDTPTSN